MTVKKLNHRQARWSLYLARFDFKLIHHPGHSMGKPNVLSRRPDYGKRAPDNEDIVSLCHDTKVAGHSECWKILELVSRDYW